MTRIVIADDHSLILAGFSRWLQAEASIEVVGNAINGNDALALVRREMPDVLLSDIEMPGIKGTELIEKALAIHPSLKIILMTVHKGWYVHKILENGNVGYIPKDLERETFVEALHWAIQGRCWVDPEEMQSDLRREKIIKEVALTPKEREIIANLHLSNKKIAEKFKMKETTLTKVHLSNIFFKLGVKNRYEALLWARKMLLIPKDFL